MKKNWEAFFEMLIHHEGGFTDDTRDSGNKKGDGHGNDGSTMLGVTAYNWARYTGKPAPKPPVVMAPPRMETPKCVSVSLTLSNRRFV